MKRVTFIGIMCMTALLAFAQSTETYVDLGLPSGTQWKTANETGHYTYGEAVKRFGKNLPSKKQFDELLNSCNWSWSDNGYTVKGPNGNSITLPANGYTYCGNKTVKEENNGLYWSKEKSSEKNAWFLFISAKDKYVEFNRLCEGLSVRLVK